MIKNNLSLSSPNLVDICRSTHFNSVTTESVDGSLLSALVFVIYKSWLIDLKNLQIKKKQ